MTNELMRELLQATLASSAAIALLLCLRRPLRVRFGAQAAYRAWLLAPLAILAVWLPASRTPTFANARVVVGAVAPAAWAAGLPLPASASTATIFTSVWAIGAVLCLVWFAVRQRRFVRLVERRAGRVLARISGQGPAVVGGWRARIVLPHDFRERYSRGERRLVLAHEIAHLRRGDLHAQGLATALRCVFWFNPLLHVAAGAFRFDQELACDAAVLARFPHGRARYGSAMLKTQLAGFGLPVGCHWQSSHPLKERIEMLKQPLPALPRKLSGALLVATLMVGGTYAAWAAQPATPSAATGTHAAPPTTPVAAAGTHAAPPTGVAQGNDLTPPRYPANAKNISGDVLLQLLVAVDGSIKKVKVIKSEPAGVFDQVSIEAARQWHIAPAKEHGVTVEHWVRVPVMFRRDDPAPAATGGQKISA